MTLRQTTLDIIGELEEASGFPAQVTGLGSLDTLATVRVARGPSAKHLVLFNPHAESPPDYLIAHACGMAIRLYSVPRRERFELAPCDAGRNAVEDDLFGDEGSMREMWLTPEQAHSLRDKLYGGIMMQLKSTPVGLRVDDWLWREHPDLRDLQTVSCREQLTEGLAFLDPRVGETVPPRQLAVSVSMHVAVAGFWSRALDDPSLVEPYQAASGEAEGRALLALWDLRPNDPVDDRALVDAWADELGIGEWYEWRSFPTPGSPAPAA
jgi:hypothetical protein